MPKRKVEEQFAVSGEKDCWHTISLQMLQPARFSKVVGKILSGQYTMVISKDGGASSKIN